MLPGLEHVNVKPRFGFCLFPEVWSEGLWKKGERGPSICVPCFFFSQTPGLDMCLVSEFILKNTRLKGGLASLRVTGGCHGGRMGPDLCRRPGNSSRRNPCTPDGLSFFRGLGTLQIGFLFGFPLGLPLTPPPPAQMPQK